jgi:hypothetical protein
MRKTKTITVPSDDPTNRDAGKVYLLTELPAARSEKWAARVLLALLASGIKIPDKTAKAGLAGLASMGGSVVSGTAGVPWEVVEPLLDEMMACVQLMVGKPGGIAVPRPIMTDDDIEEISTRLLLRKEVLELHLGFSLAAFLSTQDSEAAPNHLTSALTSQS